MSRMGRAVDALGAMYFVAALLMGIGAVVVVALMFVPRDGFSGGEDRYVPGTAEERYRGPAPSQRTPEQQRLDEETHAH